MTETKSADWVDEAHRIHANEKAPRPAGFADSDAAYEAGLERAALYHDDIAHLLRERQKRRGGGDPDLAAAIADHEAHAAAIRAFKASSR